jgi:3-oxoacyl-[acyl-carrier protein] reductase
VAVVTGGSRSTGAAACRLLAADGARVAAVGLDPIEVQVVVDELRCT